MGLITILLTGLVIAFNLAVIDYYQYEAMIEEYNAWALATNINAQ